MILKKRRLSRVDKEIDLHVRVPKPVIVSLLVSGLKGYFFYLRYT